MRNIEILDTTLRDGEQTSAVSFATQEKLSIARILLEEVGVNRIEIASARVSDGEFEAVTRICAWAAKKGLLSAIEILGFVDNGTSVEWIKSSGAKVMNLLAKGSIKHCEMQLGKSAQEHIADIKHCIALAHEAAITTNIYLEDWSNGMLTSPQYVWNLLDALQNEPITHFMLPDTLGILNPEQCYALCKETTLRYPQLRFDFHAHNDYDLATANIFAAIKGGITTIHTTINGLGERAGNTPLSSAVAVIHDQLGMTTSIRENKITVISRLVESYSGIKIPVNKPVIGDLVFTQCAGIHADGDVKNNLYYNNLLPERFGRTRAYALGKTSGRANIRKNLEVLGIHVDETMVRKVTERIVLLCDKKEVVTQEDLPYIVSDVLHSDEESSIQLHYYTLSLTRGLRPTAAIKIEIDGLSYEESAMGDGQYDAFMRALRNVYENRLHRTLPVLTNYSVEIPPGGRTDAFVHTIISWEYEGHNFKTRGFDADQTEAAIQATLKMLNKIERENRLNKQTKS